MSDESIIKQLQAKEFATRELIVHISEVEKQKFTREYQKGLIDTVRFPIWNNSIDDWTYFIDNEIRKNWHHLDDLAKLSIYLVAKRSTNHVINNVGDLEQIE